MVPQRRVREGLSHTSSTRRKVENARRFRELAESSGYTGCRFSPHRTRIGSSLGYTCWSVSPRKTRDRALLAPRRKVPPSHGNSSHRSRIEVFLSILLESLLRKSVGYLTPLKTRPQLDPVGVSSEFVGVPFRCFNPQGGSPYVPCGLSLWGDDAPCTASRHSDSAALSTASGSSGVGVVGYALTMFPRIAVIAACTVASSSPDAYMVRARDSTASRVC